VTVHGTQCRGKWVQKKIGEKKTIGLHGTQFSGEGGRKRIGGKKIAPECNPGACRKPQQDWLQKTPKTFAGRQKKKSADQKKRRLDGCIGIEARTREEEKKNNHGVGDLRNKPGWDIHPNSMQGKKAPT